MVYYSFKKHKEFFYLDLVVYLIPISIILGNLIINAISLISILIFFLLILKKKFIYCDYKTYFNFLFVFIALLAINLIFSSNFEVSIISIFGVIRYYLLFLIILFCLNNIEHFKKIFTNIIFYLIVFVLIDILIQHFFLVDIFGNEVNPSHGRRLSGPFGDEGVAGTFIAKLFFLSLFYMIEKNFIKKFIFPIIILTVITIILTNERSASIMFFSSALILFVFYRINVLYKLTCFIITILSLVIVFHFNNSLKSHFIDIPTNAFKDNHHKAHFLTAYEIFKDNKFFGSGIKTFRYICAEEKYEKINTKFAHKRCTTHPHNIYLEIISEMGILGLILIILINLYILFFLIINFFKKTHLRQEILILFCSFFILFWPLQTTGSFFSTWNGIFYWIFFSYFFYFKKLTV